MSHNYDGFVKPLLACDESAGDPNINGWCIRDANGKALTGWGCVTQTEAFAKFAALACNHHDRLVGELHKALLNLKSVWAKQTEGPDLWPIIVDLRSALDKLKEGA